MRAVGWIVAVALAAAWPAAAQMQLAQPDFRGVWSPVVGAGAAYQVDTTSRKMQIELTVVGKEDVSGKPGFWLEIATSPNGTDQTYVKNFMVLDGKSASIARMIIQPPGRGPIEMPGIMMNRGGQTPPTAADIRDQAEHVGTEDVTTPAGTFSCEHYRSKDGKWDAWLSPKVTPWGLVKSTGNNGETMVVVRLISDAKDHITGTPQKFDPAEMMRQQTGQQPPH
jgi:hypothetical protein